MPSAATPVTARLAPVALFLLPILALYLPQSLVVVLTVVTAARMGECLRARLWPSWRQPSLYLGVAVSGWAAVSAAWALSAGSALTGALSLLGFVVLAWLGRDCAGSLPPPAIRRAQAAFLTGAAVAAGLLGVDTILNGALAGLMHGYDVTDEVQNELALRSLNRGTSSLSVLSPFLALIAARMPDRRLRLAGMAVLALAIGVVLLRGKEALILGLVAGAGIGALGWLWPVLARRVMVTALVAVVLASPLATRHIPDPEWMWAHWRAIGQSTLHRLFIWRFTAGKIAEKPVTGWGMNSAKILPGGTEDVIVGSDRLVTRWRPLPLHPHNAVLHWWLELGAVGALLLGALAVHVIRAAASLRDRAARAVTLSCTANFMVVSLLSFGAWQSWWLACLLAGVWLSGLAVASSGRASSPQAPLSQEPLP